jgi:hypothetical protein
MQPGDTVKVRETTLLPDKEFVGQIGTVLEEICPGFIASNGDSVPALILVSFPSGECESFRDYHVETGLVARMDES